MPGGTDQTELQTTLKQCCMKIRRPKSTVLFRSGEKAFGMFVVLSGTVTLDFGVDRSLAMNHTYGPGALVGLPATLTKRGYSMTATVTQDAELGFWPFEALDALLRKRPDFCHQLLRILGEKIAETRREAKAFLNKEKPHSQHSDVV